MSGPYQFGVTRARVREADVPALVRIAREHGATFIQGDYTSGPVAWFECPNMGEPFDGATRRAVLDAIREAGIAYGGAS